MGCESYVHFREGKLPLRVEAGVAVLASLARALAGLWACRVLGCEGRARWVTAGERLLVGEWAWHVLGAGEGPVCTCARAFWVLGPFSAAVHAGFCACGDGARGPAMTSWLVGPAGPCAVCSVLFAALFCRMMCVLLCRIMLRAMLWSGCALCRVR